MLPYSGALDIDARLEKLENGLREDDAPLFAPAETALRSLDGKPATKTHVLCLALIARWHYYNLDFDAAAECSTAALTVARAVNEPTVLAKSLKILGISLFERGMLTEAVPVVLEGLENARIANDEREIWQSLCNLGLALSYGARYGVALECYEQATAIVNETGIWSNKGYLLLEVGEIALGLEAAQRASSLMTKVESVEQRLARVHLEVLQVRLRVAIGDIQKARVHATVALAEASRTTEFGIRLARLASLLVDAHGQSTANLAIKRLMIEVEQNKPRFSLYRTSLHVAVAALQGADRPEQALRFLREIAELDTTYRARVIAQPLPPAFSEQGFTQLDHLADARAREQLSNLLAQAARHTAATDQRLEDLVCMGIRAELREEDTFSNGEHVFRVARLAECLAQEAGCTNPQIHVVRLAGLLHDVGKTFAPDQVLLKRRTLTDKEKALLRRHSEDGAVLIENLRCETLSPVAEAVRHSHERWDGMGYPDGLQGEDIPMSARIIAICDSFDAMTHWRPFRSPRSFASAMAEIEANSGSRYDPRLSRLFVTLLRRLHRETEDLDRFLAEGAESSPVVQEQRRLAKLLRPQRETL